MKLYKSVYDAPRLWDEATAKDVITVFHDLPLPVRMRAAAVVLQAADFRSSPEIGEAHVWTRGALVARAVEWEREDAEKAAHEAEVEELAQVIYRSDGGSITWDESTKSLKENYRDNARAILNAGYRKQADDD